jgi:hypothetical protein
MQLIAGRLYDIPPAVATLKQLSISTDDGAFVVDDTIIRTLLSRHRTPDFRRRICPSDRHIEYDRLSIHTYLQIPNRQESVAK